MRRAATLVVFIAVIGTGCGGPATSSPSASAAAESTATPSLQPSPSDQGVSQTFEVDVDGLTIAGHCLGVRTPDDPAILLLHGLGANQRYFGSLFEAYLAEKSLVCVYDRPGTDGDSDAPRERPRDVAAVADEALNLMAALTIDPPYFLIGHSAGGAIGLVAAHRHPGDLAGVVALNALPPYSAWREADMAVDAPPTAPTLEESFYQGDNGEGIDFLGTDVMVEPMPAELPFAVVFGEDRTCGGFVEYCDEVYDLWVAIHEEVAATGAGGRFVFSERSGHDIVTDDGELVRSVIDDVWAEATE